MRNLALIVVVAASSALAGCGQMPWYRQMQAEAAARARITTLTAEGQAQLAKAQADRQVIGLNARMRLEAARSDAEREVVRARGVAQANAIIANSLGGPEGYLRWKYIEMLEENRTAKTIYIPTEAGLPILEAGHK
jgi:regulator of protease activity HflC (stomatin/prohibitin superfamily)